MSRLDNVLDEAELSPATMSGGDPAGIVFFWRGRVFRGIRGDKVADARKLLDSGLIRRLEEAGLFPATRTSNYNLPNFDLTLEHQRLHPMVLPGEWSVEMHRDAAIALLEINRISRQFGFETKDAHPYNFCFAGTQPVFMDFGSFVPVPGEHAGWLAHDEFVRTMRYPLILARQTGPTFTHMLLEYGTERTLSHEDYYRLRLGAMAAWLPFVPRLREYYAKFLWIGCLPDNELDRLIEKRPWVAWLRRLRRTAIFKYLTADFSRMERGIRRIGREKHRTAWGDYQGAMLGSDGTPILDSRYERICELVSKLSPESVLELGGNMGVFSLAMSMRGVAPRIVCTDYDAGAVEHAYTLFKRAGGGACTAAVVDILQDSPSIKVPSTPQRFRADVVLALAVTHHLTLKQGLQCDLLMKRIADFCERFAVIEFMPLGLWDGVNPAPAVPSWYSIDWFRTHFVTEFELLHEEHLIKNRVVFVGRKRCAVSQN